MNTEIGGSLGFAVVFLKKVGDENKVDVDENNLDVTDSEGCDSFHLESVSKPVCLLCL